MNQKNNGGPAFPVPGFKDDEYFNGISARDYFAAAALQGVIACVRDHTGATTVQDRCKKAYEYADAMLAERAKP